MRRFGGGKGGLLHVLSSNCGPNDADKQGIRGVSMKPLSKREENGVSCTALLTRRAIWLFLAEARNGIGMPPNLFSSMVLKIEVHAAPLLLYELETEPAWQPFSTYGFSDNVWVNYRLSITLYDWL